MGTASTCWRNSQRTWVSPLTFILWEMGSTEHWVGQDAGRGWSGTCWAEPLTWLSPLSPSILPGAESSISPHPSTPPALAFWYNCLKSSLVCWSLYFNDHRGRRVCHDNMLHFESLAASLSGFFRVDNMVWKYLIYFPECEHVNYESSKCRTF